MKRILYATDLDAHSDRALHRAMMLSIQHDAELLVFHVNSKPNVDIGTDISELEEQIQNTQLPDTPTAEKASLRHEIKVVSGDPIKELTTVVDDFRPDLVIMGPSRELTPVTVFYGTTVDKAITTIASPILVVKKRPYAHYRRALVAFDHTLGSRQALELVASAATGANLTIARVTDVSSDHSNKLKNIRDMVSGHVGTILQSVSAEPHIASEATILVKSGNAGEELLKCYAVVEPDILAIGRTQKTGLKSLIPGSTANLLLGHATCDVLIAGQTED